MYKILHIKVQNYKSLENTQMEFWPNKNVFVWKNDSGKTNILKAIRVIFQDKKIKKNDFFDTMKKIYISLTLEIWSEIFVLETHARINKSEIELEYIIPKKIEEFYKQIQIVYIPSDRKHKDKDPKSWYHRLINLILENKENTQLKNIYIHKILELWQIGKLSASKNTTLLISLLELYLHTIKHAKSDWFKLFLLDQPENFLHPHATKHIDNILGKIAELQNTQIFYATHSPDLVSNFKKWIYEISDIIFVKKYNNSTQIKKIDNSHGKYNKIMINLIFKNASIFFSDSVILVEWETEKIAVPNIFENWKWKKSSYFWNQSIDRYDLESKNINIIDVWWKWALADWYTFCSDIFWPENVFAIIDRDPDFFHDEEMISRAIYRTHWVKNISAKDFLQYHWVVLEWEFEYYYKEKKIFEYLRKVIQNRSEKFWENRDPKKVEKSLEILDFRMKKVIQAKKISKAYAKLFWRYFRHYGKPTIAFNLSTYLSKNDGYKKWLIEKFEYIVNKLEK